MYQVSKMNPLAAVVRSLGWFLCIVAVLPTAEAFSTAGTALPSSSTKKPISTSLKNAYNLKSSFRLSMVMEDFLVFEDENNEDGGDNNDEEEISDEELLEMAGDWDDRIARFNTVTLSGRVGNNPEPRYFDDGKVVVNLSLASRRKYHSLERMAENIKSWEDEETEWYNLEIWGQTAEYVTQFVDKGARVGVVGSVQVDEWTDRETNEPRQRAKIIVRDFDLLETRAEAEARRSNSRQGGSSGSRGNDGGYTSAGSGGFFDWREN